MNVAEKMILEEL